MARYITDDQKMTPLTSRKKIIEIARHLGRRQIHRGNVQAGDRRRHLEKLGLNGAGQLQLARLLGVGDPQGFLSLPCGRGQT
jgi:hypothetical protein